MTAIYLQVTVPDNVPKVVISIYMPQFSFYYLCKYIYIQSFLEYCHILLELGIRLEGQKSTFEVKLMLRHLMPP